MSQSLHAMEKEAYSNLESHQWWVTSILYALLLLLRRSPMKQCLNKPPRNKNEWFVALLLLRLSQILWRNLCHDHRIRLMWRIRTSTQQLFSIRIPNDAIGQPQLAWSTSSGDGKLHQVRRTSIGLQRGPGWGLSLWPPWVPACFPSTTACGSMYINCILIAYLLFTFGTVGIIQCLLSWWHNLFVSHNHFLRAVFYLVSTINFKNRILNNMTRRMLCDMVTMSWWVEWRLNYLDKGDKGDSCIVTIIHCSVVSTVVCPKWIWLNKYLELMAFFTAGCVKPHIKFGYCTSRTNLQSLHHFNVMRHVMRHCLTEQQGTVYSTEYRTVQYCTIVICTASSRCGLLFMALQ